MKSLRLFVVVYGFIVLLLPPVMILSKFWGVNVLTFTEYVIAVLAFLLIVQNFDRLDNKKNEGDVRYRP